MYVQRNMYEFAEKRVMFVQSDIHVYVPHRAVRLNYVVLLCDGLCAASIASTHLNSLRGFGERMHFERRTPAVTKTISRQCSTSAPLSKIN